MILVGLICIVGAYLIGSIPFGVLIASSQGIDIREHGSKNIGATNVSRVLGRPLGITCFILDFLKGAVPVIIAGNVMNVLGEPVRDLTGAEMLWWLGVAVATVLGHMFSVYLKFAGGKGVATTFGSMVAMWPILTIPAMCGLVVWYTALRLTRYVAVASIAGALSIPIAYLLCIVPNSGDVVPALLHGWPPFAVTALLSVLVAFRHRANIGRLRRGEEPKVKGSKRRGDLLASSHQQ